MIGVIRQFHEGLSRTKEALFGALGGLVGRKRIDEATIDLLEESFFGADFGVDTAEEIIEEIRHAYSRDRDLRGREAAEIGASVLRSVLKDSEGRLAVTGQSRPEVICLTGINGSGKTTTAAKLGYRLQADGRSVMLGACDTFRAAANEQIRIWSERLHLDLVSSHQGADAAAVAFDAYDGATRRGRDVLILDTAGRLHTKGNLMDELKKIRRVLQKRDSGAPHHSWIVVDGNLGSNSIQQARVFHREFGLTGVVITKLDGSSRGGALVGIFRELKLPIYFVGLGEQPEDLQEFSVNDYVNAIFGLS